MGLKSVSSPVSVSAKTGFRAFLLRMQTAGFGAFFIHGAASCFDIEKIAIPAGAASHGEDVVLRVVMVNQPHLEQALGNHPGFYVFHLKGVYQFQSNEVRQLHFQWHGAAIGSAAFAQTAFVLAPSLKPVHINNTDRGFHGGRQF